MLHLEIYNKTRNKISSANFLSLLKPAYNQLIKDKRISREGNFEIELTFVGNSTITKLNKKYHQKNRTTDVISLSYFEKKMIDPFVGEIFICVPYAQIQAKKIGQSLKDELAFLFVHGLLHTFGYDHMKVNEEKHMLDLTYRILGRK